MKKLLHLLSKLPLWLHYTIADLIIFPLLYHIVRYRRKLTRTNLRNSFPTLSFCEIKLIERKFYRFFSYLIVETIYGYRSGGDFLKKHVEFKNLDILSKFAKQKGGCIVMLGHNGNWEWLADYSNQINNPEVKSFNIYRTLKNSTFNELIIDIRRKRGGDVLEKNMALRHIIANKNQHINSIYVFLSDQKPSANALDYWTTFLNQDTPVILGAEQIARKLDFPVVYGRIKRTKRGYYEANMEVISENPKQTEPYQITEKFIRMLESDIKADPTIWLWTHNRWKFKHDE